MKYETALKLKEAGFPQITFDTLFPYRGHYEALIDGRVRDLGDGTSTIPQENLVYIPTLEELIEACGENFWALTKLKMRPDLGWKAEQYVVGSSVESLGKTPDEAVANLWIALYSKPL